jgi:hypothetical protein
LKVGAGTAQNALILLRTCRSFSRDTVISLDGILIVDGIAVIDQVAVCAGIILETVQLGIGLAKLSKEPRLNSLSLFFLKCFYIIASYIHAGVFILVSELIITHG